VPASGDRAALQTEIRRVGGERMSTLLGATPVPDTAVQRCTCGHAELEHDAVARRYCAATSSAELTRDCICRVASGRPQR
jgi:hypothetical protein